MLNLRFIFFCNSPFAIKQKTVHLQHKNDSLAQLVQSTCLTGKGSVVQVHYESLGNEAITASFFIDDNQLFHKTKKQQK